MTRLWHFQSCAVTRAHEAYAIREQRGIPLGLSPSLWRYGWGAWLEATEDGGLSAADARDLCAREGAPLGLLAMRPLGTPNDGEAATSFRIDARDHFEEAGRDAATWIEDLHRNWAGPLVCGIGSQPRQFTPTQFLNWTAPFWGAGAKRDPDGCGGGGCACAPPVRVSFDACAGEAEGTPIHTCLSIPGVRERVLIERAPRLVDAHWHGYPVFGLHRGANDADRLPMADWPVGSIVRVEHKDPDRSPEEAADLAEALLGEHPQIGVALDVTRLGAERLRRLVAAATGA